MKTKFFAAVVSLSLLFSIVPFAAIAQQYSAAGELYIQRADETGNYQCMHVPYGTGASISFLALTVPVRASANGPVVAWDCPNAYSNLHTMVMRLKVADEDVGLPGGVGIGAVQTNIRELVAFYANGVWKSIEESFEPVVTYQSMPSYVEIPISVPSFNECLQRRQSYHLYIGYGVLTNHQRQSIDTFYRLKAPTIPPEHLARVFIEHDAESKHKYGRVVTIDCSGRDSP